MKINTSEIEESMAALLTPSFIEKNASSNNVTNAIDSLVKAAEIFENLNLPIAASATTDILNQIAKSLENK